MSPNKFGNNEIFELINFDEGTYHGEYENNFLSKDYYKLDYQHLH